jgi:hypothetical protein
MHAFAGWADERYRGVKLIATASMDFLAHAHQSHGVIRARVGTGRHPITSHLLAPLKTVADGLGWQIREGGWVDLDPSVGRPARAPRT